MKPSLPDGNSLCCLLFPSHHGIANIFHLSCQLTMEMQMKDCGTSYADGWLVHRSHPWFCTPRSAVISHAEPRWINLDSRTDAQVLSQREPSVWTERHVMDGKFWPTRIARNAALQWFLPRKAGYRSFPHPTVLYCNLRSVSSVDPVSILLSPFPCTCCRISLESSWDKASPSRCGH